ncbi:hypothetical protein BJ742DRAFT_254076 [Cladochytrium replicatum]|nr:hypothetical protein BJ742DRAFT_254076 [Cladochytrium replicatum]
MVLHLQQRGRLMPVLGPNHTVFLKLSAANHAKSQRRKEKGKQPAIIPISANLLTRTRSSTSTLIAQDELMSTSAGTSAASKSKDAVYRNVREALKEVERGNTSSSTHAALKDYFSYAEALLGSLREQLNSANERAQKVEEGLGQTQELLKEVLRNGGDESHLARAVHCTICMEPFAEPHVIDCGHSYCYTCLSLWLKKSRSCPSCRAVVTAIPVRNRALLECVEAHLSRMEPAAADMAKSRVRREQENFRRLVSPWGEILPLGPDPIDDQADQVLRCPMCTWEVVDGLCVNCGAAYGGTVSSGEDAEILSDYYDSDMSGHSRIYLDDEAEEAEDSDDEENYIRQFRRDFGSPAFSESNHTISSDDSYSPGFAPESPDYIPRSNAWLPRACNNRSLSRDYFSAPATPEHASNSDADMHSPERSPPNYPIFNNDEIVLRSRRIQPVQYYEQSEDEDAVDGFDEFMRGRVRRPVPIFSDGESEEVHDMGEPVEEEEGEPDGEDDLTVGRGVRRIPTRIIISDGSSDEDSEHEHGQINGADSDDRVAVGSDDDGEEDENSDGEIMRRIPNRKGPWTVSEAPEAFDSSSSNGRGGGRAIAVPSRPGARRPARRGQGRRAIPNVERIIKGRGDLANRNLSNRGHNSDSSGGGGQIESPSSIAEDTDQEQTDSSIQLPVENRLTDRSSSFVQHYGGSDSEDEVGESDEEPSDEEGNSGPQAQIVLDMRRPRYPVFHTSAENRNGNESGGRFPLRLEQDVSAATGSYGKAKQAKYHGETGNCDEQVLANGMLRFERQWRETLRQPTEAAEEVRRLIEGSKCLCGHYDQW